MLDRVLTSLLLAAVVAVAVFLHHCAVMRAHGSLSAQVSRVAASQLALARHVVGGRPPSGGGAGAERERARAPPPDGCDAEGAEGDEGAGQRRAAPVAGGASYGAYTSARALHAAAADAARLAHRSAPYTVDVLFAHRAACDDDPPVEARIEELPERVAVAPVGRADESTDEEGEEGVPDHAESASGQAEGAAAAAWTEGGADAAGSADGAPQRPVGEEEEDEAAHGAAAPAVARTPRGRAAARRSAAGATRGPRGRKPAGAPPPES